MKRKYLLFIAVFIAIGFIFLSGEVQAYQSNSKYTQEGYQYDQASKLYYKVISGEIAITGVSEGVTNVTVPSYINGMKVTEIAENAFQEMSCTTTIKTVYLPDTIINIGDSAFRKCERLESIRMPNKLKFIGWGAFYQCKSLRSIEISADINKSSIFSGCSRLEKVVFTEGVTNIVYLRSIFDSECYSLSEIYIPNTVKTVNTYMDSRDINGATIYLCANSPRLSSLTSYFYKHGISYSILRMPFFDVKSSDWFYNSVKYVYDNSIILGTSEHKFQPNGKLTRGMLATILWRMEGMPTATGGKNFNDVKSSDYYYEAIKWASSKRIVNGYSDTKFGPNNNITREQLAVMLNNYAKYKKKNVNNLANISGYIDAKKVSTYAKEAVQWAIKNKIISGKSNGTKIDPQGNATRAEAAAMIQNFKAYV